MIIRRFLTLSLPLVTTLVFLDCSNNAGESNLEGVPLNCENAPTSRECSIQNQLKDIIDNIAPLSKDFRAQLKLREDLELDELNLTELIVEIEDHFKISVNDDDVAQWITVQDVIDYIKARLG